MSWGAPACTLVMIRSRRTRTSDAPAGQAEPAGVEAGHVEELGDQPAEPVGVGVDGGQHQQLLLVVEPGPAAEHRLDEALHAGQRRPQLVGHRGDQVGPLAVQAGPTATGADGDGHARGRSQRLVAHDPRRDQALVAVGQHPRLLGDAGAGARALERRVVLQPRTPVVAGQREHVDELRPDHLRAVDAEQLFRGPVDQHHGLVAVEDDDAVGQDVDRLTALPLHDRHPMPSCASRTAELRLVHRRVAPRARVQLRLVYVVPVPEAQLDASPEAQLNANGERRRRRRGRGRRRWRG